MPRKRLGKGIVLKLASTAIGEIINLTPPGKTREEVDVTTQDDSIMEFLDADQIDQGTVTFTVVWEPGDTNSELLDTLMDNTDVDARNGSWEIDYTMFTAPMPTDAFSGRIIEMTPAQVATKDLVARDITIRLTTAVTRTSTP